MKRVAKRLFQSLPGPLDRFVRASGRRVFGVSHHRAAADSVLGPVDVRFDSPRVDAFIQETYKWPKRVLSTSVDRAGVYGDPGVSVIRLPHAVVAGDGRAFDSRHRLVAESLATHDYQAVNFGPRTQRPDMEIDGVVINLNWWSGNTNVYHWLRDVFPRAFVLTRQYADESFTIVGPTAPTPFQQHGFDALLRQFPGARYVGLEYGSKARVEMLLQPCMAPYVRGCGYLRPEVARFVRDTHLAGVTPATLRAPHTYISRANTSSRRLLNEADVLERIGERIPLNVLRIEELPWRDQLATMAATNLLAGVYGAGLVHMLFTQGGGVVEIHNGDSAETHFATLATGCGVPFVSVQGGAADRMQDFSLSREQTDVLIAALDASIDRAERGN